MKEFFKIFGLIILAAIIIGGYRYYTFSHINRFSRGKIIEVTKLSRKSGYTYEFSIANNKMYSGAKRGETPLDGQKFCLVGYCSSNPSINYAFENYKLTEKTNIDSLNKYHSPQDFIKFKDYFVGGHISF